MDDNQRAQWREEIHAQNLSNGFYDSTVSGKKVVEEPNYHGMADYLREVMHLKWNDSIAFIYNGQCYEQITLNTLKNLIVKLTQYKCKRPTELFGFLEFSKSGCNFTDRMVPKAGLINLQNGVLNVATGELQKHSPDFNFKYCLPHTYDPTATAPEWSEFLLRTFDGDKELIDLSAEIFGYILMGGNPFLHKAFILYGEGRNGKSTWLDVLKYLVGGTNCAAIPLESLDKPFSVVTADGKLVNITGELTTKEISSSAFKTAVSGENLMAAQKGKPEYEMPFHARLVFATNKPPFFRDATTGSHEKLCLIPFRHYIRPEDRLPLYAEIRLFPEISGVLNWALDGLRRLLRDGHLTSASAVKSEVEAYRFDSDSVFTWCHEFVKPLRVDDVACSNHRTYLIGDYYGHYEEWCAAQKYSTVSKPEFGRRVSAFVKTFDMVSTKRSGPGMVLQGKVLVTASKKYGSNFENLQNSFKRLDE